MDSSAGIFDQKFGIDTSETRTENLDKDQYDTVIEGTKCGNTTEKLR